MKNFIKCLGLMSLTVLFACNSQEVADTEESVDPNFRIIEGSTSRSSLGDICITKDLIVAQNTIGGTVTVSTDGYDVMVTYNVNSDWTISETHLSIGDCEQHIPVNGGGNPKVGKFEHSSNHSNVTEVSYLVSRDALPEDIYCFAAHAKVNGVNGGSETGWAEGLPFDGNNWAMYCDGSFFDCDAGGSGGGGGGGGA